MFVAKYDFFIHIGAVFAVAFERCRVIYMVGGFDQGKEYTRDVSQRVGIFLDGGVRITDRQQLEIEISEILSHIAVALHFSQCDDQDTQLLEGYRDQITQYAERLAFS